MKPIDKMQAILNRLSQIPLQEYKIMRLSAEEALAKVSSEEELDFYYNKLVKEG